MTTIRTIRVRWWTYGFCASNVLTNLLHGEWVWLSVWLAWTLTLVVVNTLTAPTPETTPDGAA